MSRQRARPTKAQSKALSSELDKLVKIDQARNALQAQAADLQSQRATQVGRMQVLAEQLGIDLEQFVGDELRR